MKGEYRIPIRILLVAWCLASVFSDADAQSSRAPEHLSWHGDPGAPDISGVWARADAAGEGENQAAGGKSKEGWHPWPPPLKGAYAELWKKRVQEASAGKRTDDPIISCLPPGMPRYMSGTKGPLLIIQTPGRVTLYRDGQPVRRIWLDGRSFAKAEDLEEFSNGTAIGHYEGVDMLTEVEGLKEQIAGIKVPIDSTGISHSPQLKILERYHRVDDRTLIVQITLTDPLAFTKAMTTTVIYKALQDPLWEPREFICKPQVDYHPEIYVR